MNFNKKEPSEIVGKSKNKISAFINSSGMSLFISRVAIVWILIFIAFWLGAGCVGLRQWDESVRYIMVFVMIAAFIPVVISIQFREDE